MSVRASQWAWEQGKRHGLSSGQLLVLVRIADHADNDGVCWPGNKGLAEHCVCDESTVRRRIQALAKKQLLLRERRALKQGRGRKHDAIVLQMKADDQTGNSPGWSETIKQAPLHGPNRQYVPVQTGNTDRALYRGTNNEPSVNQKKTVDLVADIYDFWKTQTARSGATKLTPNRRRLVQARLDEGYEPERIREAIHRVAGSPWHRGDNDRGERFDDLTLICRNGENIERFESLEAKGAVRSLPRPDRIVEDPTATEAWAKTRDQIKATWPSRKWQTWIEPLELAGVSEGKLILLDNSGQAGWADGKFSGHIVRVLREVSDFTEVRICDDVELELAAA